MIQTIDIDIRGQICPSCLLLALKAINEHGPALHAGRVEIRVTTDDRQSTSTIPTTADRMGFCSEVVRDGEAYSIRIFGKA